MSGFVPKKGRYRPFDESAGPWLIWSHHWGRWHVRSATGGAAGYTSDIASAGVFDASAAKAYHDSPPHRRDEAIPARRAVKGLETRLAEMDAERARFADTVEKVRAALKTEGA